MSFVGRRPRCQPQLVGQFVLGVQLHNADGFQPVAPLCLLELGKVPYCGEVQAYAQIVADSPVPVVAAGGPQCKTLGQALTMMSEVVTSGARGATIGRNIWGFSQISAAVQAFKTVIHDGKTADEALAAAGLTGEGD